MNEEIIAYCATLKDGNGNFIYPQTKTEAVYDENGVNLGVILKQQEIIISATQPAGQVAGGLWCEIIE